MRDSNLTLTSFAHSKGSKSEDNVSYASLRPTRVIELSESEQRQFWSQVSVGATSECWPWKGTISDPQGYAVWKTFKVHRIAYTLAFGPIPQGFTIDHVRARGCTMRHCCNPAHLEAVTQSVNTARQYSKPDRLYSLTHNCGHAREFSSPTRCRPCFVKMVARSQAKRADYYRGVKRLNKQNERYRKLA